MRCFFSEKSSGRVPECAVFLSGTGTNARKLLEYMKDFSVSSFRVSCLVTDRPETSAARLIASEYSLPLVEHDIVKFYHANGLESLSIATGRGMEVREKWTEKLRLKLAPFTVDFGVFAGFVPLTNIAEDFPCLNVHPGDLTLEDAHGRRLLAGLHLLPLEKAVLLGFESVRSSVIVVQTVTRGGGEVDTGPVLGVSEPMMLDLSPEEREKLVAVHAARAGKKRSEYRSDALETAALRYQNLLKEHGDWIVLPRVVRDFAEGAFDIAPDGVLLHRGVRVKTCEYSANGAVRDIFL